MGYYDKNLKIAFSLHNICECSYHLNFYLRM